MNNLDEVSTIEEGFFLGKSFIIRGLDLPCNLETCKEMANGIELVGYNGNNSITILASKAFEDFENNTLDVNIIDAAFPVLLDKDLPTALWEAVQRSNKPISLTLTQNGAYTPLHIDPPNGGGWMYLQQGTKKWQLIEPEYIELFFQRGKTITDDLKDPPKDYDSNFIYETTIMGGDFIFFTALTPHRVWTYENSFGVSGYAKP